MKSTTRATGVPGGLALRVDDGLSNVVSGMGHGRDRASFNRWSLGSSVEFGPFLIDTQQIDAAYRTSALVRRVHDIIPDEMTREWRQWSTDAETITKIEAEEKRLNVEGVIFECLRLARIAGGCALVMGLPGEPSEPAPASIGPEELAYLIPIPRTAIQIDDLNADLLSPYFGQPNRYRLQSANKQAEIHPSRVIAFKGMPSSGSRFMTKEDRFWGHPLMEGLNDQLQNVTMGQNALAQLIPEAKVDIVHIPGLTDMVSTMDGEQRLARRLQAAKALQSMFGINVLDGGDGKEGSGERWAQRQITWAGLPDVMRTLFLCLASYAETPLTKLIGDQAKGLNNGGEQDERNFETTIKTKQKRDLKPRLERLDFFLVPSAGITRKTTAITWTFSPLHIPTPEEQADLDQKTAETFETLRNTGLIQHDALAQTCVAVLSERPTFAGLAEAVEQSSEPIPALEQDKREAEGAKVENKTRLLQSSRGALKLKAVGRDTLMNDATPRTMYVSRKVLNPQEVLGHYRREGLENLLPAKDLHVTLFTSVNEVDWMAIPQDWASREDGKLRVPAGGPRVNEILGSFVVLEFASDELRWRNQQFMDAGAISRWSEFKPHVSVASGVGGETDVLAMKPYTGRLVLGPEIFEEVLP